MRALENRKNLKLLVALFACSVAFMFKTAKATEDLSGANVNTGVNVEEEPKNFKTVEEANNAFERDYGNDISNIKFKHSVAYDKLDETYNSLINLKRTNISKEYYKEFYIAIEEHKNAVEAYCNELCSDKDIENLECLYYKKYCVGIGSIDSFCEINSSPWLYELKTKYLNYCYALFSLNSFIGYYGETISRSSGHSLSPCAFNDEQFKDDCRHIDYWFKQFFDDNNKPYSKYRHFTDYCCFTVDTVGKMNSYDMFNLTNNILYLVWNCAALIDYISSGELDNNLSSIISHSEWKKYLGLFKNEKCGKDLKSNVENLFNAIISARKDLIIKEKFKDFVYEFNKLTELIEVFKNRFYKDIITLPNVELKNLNVDSSNKDKDVCLNTNSLGFVKDAASYCKDFAHPLLNSLLRLYDNNGNDSVNIYIQMFEHILYLLFYACNEKLSGVCYRSGDGLEFLKNSEKYSHFSCGEPKKLLDKIFTRFMFYLKSLPFSFNGELVYKDCVKNVEGVEYVCILGKYFDDSNINKLKEYVEKSGHIVDDIDEFNNAVQNMSSSVKSLINFASKKENGMGGEGEGAFDIFLKNILGLTGGGTSFEVDFVMPENVEYEFYKPSEN